MANNGGVNGVAGGLTIAEAKVSAPVPLLVVGNISTIIGTNTLILTNGGRLRFQNGGGTGGVILQRPFRWMGRDDFRANSFMEFAADGGRRADD